LNYYKAIKDNNNEGITAHKRYNPAAGAAQGYERLCAARYDDHFFKKVYNG
jgi:hypothetical protein